MTDSAHSISSEKSAVPQKQSKGSVLIYIFGALGGLNWGYDTGVIGAAMLYINPEFELGPWGAAWVVSYLIVGALFGAAVGGRFSDKWGRRKVLLLTAVIFCVGPVGMAVAPTAGVLMFFRFVIGLGAGLAAVVLPVYLSEIAPQKVRGAVTAFYALAIVAGQLIGFLIGALYASSGNWRMMLGLSLVPSVAFLAGLLVIWETPRWLVQKGRIDEARAVLLKDRTPQEAEAELKGIMKAHEEEHGASPWQEIRELWVRPILIVGLGLAVFQQSMGINTIMYYAPITFVQVGFEQSAAVIANVGVGIMNVFAVILAIKFADNWGRRPLLLLGSAGAVISLGILAVANMILPPPDGLGPVGIVTMLCIFVYIFLFQMSWGSIVWVVLGEIFPMGIRGLAMGIATWLLWAANAVVAILFPPMLAAFGVGALFGIFALICAAAFVFTWRKLPETKGKSLEEIEDHFRHAAS